MNRYQFLIGGVDKTEWVQPGVSLDLNLGDKGRGRLRTVDPDGSFWPAVGATVEILDNSVSPALSLFEGLVERIELQSPAGTSAITCDCSLTDYGGIVDRRVVVRFFNLASYGLLHAIVQALVDDEMASEGYTFDSANSINVGIGDVLFAGVSLREVFDSLAKLAGCTWKIFPDKSVRFFSNTSGYEAAPVDLTDALENYVTARTSQTQGTFANRIYAKGTRDLASMWADSVIANGTQTQFPTTYTLRSVPVVEVNGTPQIVIESARLLESPQPSYDFYYIQDGIGIFQNLSSPVLNSGDEVTISYISPLPYLGLAESPLSIASLGLFERIIEARDARQKDVLDAAAAEELARLVDRPESIEIVTYAEGFAPGQMIHVDIAQPPILGDYIIESVSAREIDTLFFGYTLRMTAANVPKASSASNPSNYFKDVIAATRLPEAIPVETITFILAGTIEGLTNPGLTAGAKQTSKVIKVGGTIKEISLRWATAPAATVEVDVLVNGASVFSGAGITSAAGSTAVSRVTSGFATQRLDVGDIVTISITSASAAAKDGTLDIVIS